MRNVSYFKQKLECLLNIFTPKACYDQNLYSHIKVNETYWKNCDIILACPATYKTAEKLLKKQHIVQVCHIKEIETILSNFSRAKVKSIGFLSFDLVNHIFTNETLLLSIIQRCSNNIVLLYKKSLRFSTLPRKLLHKAGFYEIFTPFIESCFSTYGVLPDGEFIYQLQTHGVPELDDSWQTHIASRLQLKHSHSLSWQQIIGQPKIDRNKSTLNSSANDFSLIIKNPPKNISSFDTTIISGIIKPITINPYHHVSLVSCYAGPSDLNMYAALVEFPDYGIATISLWKNNGEWACLQRYSLPLGSKNISQKDDLQLPIWLKVTPTNILIGSQDKIIINIKDEELLRTGTTGLRICGNSINISDILVNYTVEAE